MRWFFRTLLVWLMVLALPAQGLAAATMAFCGPNHHGGGIDRVAMSGAPEHLHHGDGLSVHGLDASASAEHASTDGSSAVEKASEEVQQKCSACASCCSLGALLSPVPAVPATDSVPTVFITVVRTVDAVAADGPDRPPRYVFA